jgi:hypothetical protein
VSGLGEALVAGVMEQVAIWSVSMRGFWVAVLSVAVVGTLIAVVRRYAR